MPAQVRPVLKFVRTSGLCVLKQLRLEETLFRASHENWVIANDGTNETAIVMGISGKPHHLLDVAKVHEDMILTIKRFTGGGTVVVDGDTQFVSLIMNASVIPHVQLFPVPLMHWASAVYKGIEHEESTSNKPPDDASSSDSRKSSGVFHDVPSWRVHQNDYVVGDGATDVKKVGGNAQVRFFFFRNQTVCPYACLTLRPPLPGSNRGHTDTHTTPGTNQLSLRNFSRTGPRTPSTKKQTVHQ